MYKTAWVQKVLLSFLTFLLYFSYFDTLYISFRLWPLVVYRKCLQIEGGSAEGIVGLCQLRFIKVTLYTSFIHIYWLVLSNFLWAHMRRGCTWDSQISKVPGNILSHLLGSWQNLHV